MKKIARIILVVGFVPVTAFGTMEYKKSRSCGCGDSVDTEVSQPKYNFVRNEQFVVLQPEYDFVQNDNDAIVADDQNNKKQYNFQKRKAVKNDTVSVKNWYLAGNIIMNLWSWENEYQSDYSSTALIFDKDEYSFESVFGGSVAVGMKFDSNLRGDVELGFSSEFSDSDDLAKFTMSVPYLMINVYNDFDSGLYFGGGLGIAKPTIKIDGALFDGNGSENSSLSPKAGVAVGYSSEVADNVYIDARYRLSLLKGTDISESFLWTENSVTGQYVLQVENDLILENALSLGLRINF